MAAKYLSSGTLSEVKSVTAPSTELVIQSGNRSFQSELVQGLAYFDREHRENSPYYLPAVYAQLSYVLTGEGRNYKNGNSGFKGIKPEKNVVEDGGVGAWEIAVRYSYASLESQDIHGHLMRNTTIGLNWYPNPDDTYLHELHHFKCGCIQWFEYLADENSARRLIKSPFSIILKLLLLNQRRPT